MIRPIIQTWKSAHAFANSDDYHALTVTREEYNEGGSNACRRKFRKFDWDPIKEKAPQTSRSTRRDKLEVNTPDESEKGDVEDEDKETTKPPSRKRQKPGPSKQKQDLPRRK
jgi:actin-related protein 6